MPVLVKSPSLLLLLAHFALPYHSSSGLSAFQPVTARHTPPPTRTCTIHTTQTVPPASGPTIWWVAARRFLFRRNRGSPSAICLTIAGVIPWLPSSRRFPSSHCHVVTLTESPAFAA